jgi:hypothetical protein
VIAGDFNATQDSVIRFPAASQSQSPRVSVPIHTLLIGTNTIRFHPGSTTGASQSPGHNRYQADYAFSGSYYHAYREIMQFQPESLPRFKGEIS